MKELHSKPETIVEQRDMLAITDPRRQTQLASNQGVRFYVEQQNMSMEDAIMREMQDGFAAQSESWRQLNEQVEFLTRAVTDLQNRLGIIEGRWYERLMQYFEWDWLTFRIWLFERWHIGNNPIPVEE